MKTYMYFRISIFGEVLIAIWRCFDTVYEVLCQRLLHHCGQMPDRLNLENYLGSQFHGGQDTEEEFRTGVCGAGRSHCSRTMKTALQMKMSESPLSFCDWLVSFSIWPPSLPILLRMTRCLYSHSSIINTPLCVYTLYDSMSWPLQTVLPDAWEFRHLW